jgi:hypothetical protein
MRRVSLVLDVLGVALVAVGGFMFSTAAGFAIAGVGLLALSFLMERE